MLNVNSEEKKPLKYSGLYHFLMKYQDEILAMTEQKAFEITGIKPTSDQLKKGLPLFYQQLLSVLLTQGEVELENNKLDAAENSDEADVAKTAGDHGVELQRLGYTLSHVVHGYGSICQSITELASKTQTTITPDEFHDLNRCLDIAIAEAVTSFAFNLKISENTREVEHLGFLAHELRNALTSINISLQLIKRGTVGFGGSTGQVLDKGLQRIEDLIDRSLTEVRLRVDPKVEKKSEYLLQIVDQILLTAMVQALAKKQTIDVKIDPSLQFLVDHQLMHSAISNLIINAIKFTPAEGKILIRAKALDGNIIIEVEDECGGLPQKDVDLFKAFEQQHNNKKGLGLGLTIAKRAIELNDGSIEVQDLPGHGCIFKITLPQLKVENNNTFLH